MPEPDRHIIVERDKTPRERGSVRREIALLHRRVERLEAARFLSEPASRIAELRRDVDRQLERVDAPQADQVRARLMRPSPRDPRLRRFEEGSPMTEWVGGVESVVTARGCEIYRVRCETFPGHINYIYVFALAGRTILFDVGSGFGASRQDLLDGLRVVAAASQGAISLDTIDTILISHGHIDHFGDVAHFVAETGAALWAHELDARILEHFVERHVLSGQNLRVWLARSGASQDLADALSAMYLAGKDFYHDGQVTVSRRLRHGQRLCDDRLHLIHTPGHCPGHLCVAVDDVLLVADQVLDPISPHISPQALNPHNGLERYLFGLSRLRLLKPRVTLPAHFQPIDDLGGRIDAIVQDHVDKLGTVREVCRGGATIADVAKALYGKQSGYNILLALLEAGSHVEYLHQISALVTENLDALIAEPTAAPVYRTTDAPGEIPALGADAEPEAQSPDEPS